MNAVICGETSSPSGFGATAADRKGYKLKMAAKVTAAEAFSTDCLSENVCIDELLEAVGKRDRQFNRIGLSSRGFLTPEFASGFSEHGGAWIKHLKLATNVHYQNASLEVAAKGRKIRIRIISDIKVGDEIQMWFSQEVLLAMQIPFLTPANIKGEV